MGPAPVAVLRQYPHLAPKNLVCVLFAVLCARAEVWRPRAEVCTSKILHHTSNLAIHTPAS